MTDDVPPDLQTMTDARIERSAGCSGCGYDLRGLGLEGRCPECGRPVMRSVLDVVDPAASLFPVVRRPRLVGDVLVLVVGLILLAVAADATLRGIGVARGAARWPSVSATWLPGVAALLAVLPALLLAPPRGNEEAIRRAVHRLALGLAGWGAGLALGGWAARRGGGAAELAIVGLGLRWGALIIALFALRQVVQVAGERSRQFRTARGGRQRIRDLVFAAAAGGIGEAVLVGAGMVAGPAADAAGLLGAALLLVSQFMLVVGFVYLLVNVGWIRRALRKPPPTLAELLTPLPVAEPEPDDAASKSADEPSAGLADPPPPRPEA